MKTFLSFDELKKKKYVFKYYKANPLNKFLKNQSKLFFELQKMTSYFLPLSNGFLN